MDIVDYDALRKEQAEKRKRGELMGIGISSFTEIVGAGPSHTFDILGLQMLDSREIRTHPTAGGSPASDGRPTAKGTGRGMLGPSRRTRGSLRGTWRSGKETPTRRPTASAGPRVGAPGGGRCRLDRGAQDPR